MVLSFITLKMTESFLPSLPISIRGSYDVEKMVFESTEFEICTLKEKRKGIVRRLFLYIHFDGEQWHILTIKGDDIKAYKLHEEQI